MLLKLLGMSLAFATISGVAVAQQKPPAGRTGLDPSANSKLSIVQARARIETEETEAAVERSLVTGPSGSNCTTNVGGSTNSAKPQTGDRFGPNKGADQIVVVKGPVINLCK
jgi:hypothetical protein